LKEGVDFMKARLQLMKLFAQQKAAVPYRELPRYS
jgi:hypothetical protein